MVGFLSMRSGPVGHVLEEHVLLHGFLNPFAAATEAERLTHDSLGLLVVHCSLLGSVVRVLDGILGVVFLGDLLEEAVESTLGDL